ncbi:hypothetical protein FYC62_02665 [Pedobacter aquae]|uniref:Guanylate cyclase domain-containing protein n=1 Tax=Pedobacter aquae TaxID=2605747 RepID=A0A5C0VD77_9SPHI|nr:hypothetical protein [Pedobacter aquae]QEK50688.1 hypothetical protein FYC62_02665 [Pedobacter aquae]
MNYKNILDSSNEEIFYEERIIAFIDILAFRDFINDTIDKSGEVNKEKLVNIVNALKLIKKEFDKIDKSGEAPYSLITTFFSDSIVLSLRKDYSIGLLKVFETLKIIQIKLIEYGILLRGGIVFGKLIHQPDVILGPAMNEAYDLESKSALYPRITIDPDIMEMMAKENELSDSVYTVKDYDFHKTFEIDFDNTYYINYFSDVANYLNDGDEIKYYQKLRQLIRNGVKRTDIGIRMKYMWMLRKFNIGKPSKIKDMVYRELDDLNNLIAPSDN